MTSLVQITMMLAFLCGIILVVFAPTAAISGIVAIGSWVASWQLALDERASDILGTVSLASAALCIIAATLSIVLATRCP